MFIRMRSWWPSVLLASALLTVPASASAQLLDDVWFKVRVAARGRSLDNTTGDVAKAQTSVTAYLHFTKAIIAPTDAGGPPSVAYTIDVVTEVSPGVFQTTYTNALQGLWGKEEALAVDMFLEFHLAGGASGNYFAGDQVVVFDIRSDAQGNFQKGTLRSLGGETSEGTLDDGASTFVGSLKMTGVSIAAGKLPFPASG